MDVNANNKQSAFAGLWKKRNAAHPSAVLLGDLAAAAAVFLLARTHLLFGAYPLGLACLAALRGWYALAGLLGGLLSAMGMGNIGYIYAALMALTLGMRLIVSLPGKGRRVLPDSEGVFRELPQLRASVACIVGFGAALYQLLIAGPTTTTLLFAAAMLISTPVATLLFSGLFDASLTVEQLLGRAEQGVPSPMRDKGAVMRLSVGALSLGFFLTVSLGGVSFFGLSLAYVFSAAATLYVSKRLGALRASVFGLVITLGVSPLYAPSFALLGLLSGALWELGAFYALSLGIAGGAVWSSYVGQLSGFLALAPELAIVSMVIWPVLGRIGSASEAEQQDSRPGELAVRRFAKEREHAPGRHVAALQASLASLSETVRGLSGVIAEPDNSEYLHAVEGACEKHCGVCPRRDACVGRGEATRAIADRLAAGQEADTSCLAQVFVRDCGSIGVILTDARAAAAMLRSGSQTERSVCCASLDYELLSRLLSDAAARDAAERRADAALGGEICRRLAERGVAAVSAAVYGDRCKELMVGGVAPDGASLSAEELHGILEQICSCRLAQLCYTEQDGALTLHTQTVRKFAVQTHRAYRAASSEQVSGDTVSFFEGSDDRFYALLSDGMGSGKRAAVTSGVSAVFLEKLLSAGCSKTTSMKMLNNLLRTSGEESSATVDLLELDLLSGRATFIKSGAAPSYVKRGENLFRIRSRTVSVGLTETLDAEKIRFDAQPGDIIVMLSDGVSQSPEDAPWLMEILSGDLGQDLSAAAERIVGVASGVRDCRDDMSVALVRISEIGAEKREASANAAPIAEIVLEGENEAEKLEAAV